MLSLGLVLAAVVCCGLSGLPAFLFSRGCAAGQLTSFALMAAGSVLGLAGVASGALSLGEAALSWPWLLPWGGFAVGLDNLTDFFLVLVFVVPTLGAWYGLEYWKQSEHPGNGQRLGLALGLLTASMALVVMARDGVLFLLAWEVMALAAFFAVTTEDDVPEVRRAGWVYLVATHVGTLCLLVMFALWSRESGSFALEAQARVTGAAASAIFVLALVGFGFKAGLMPLHFWLPGAHANAPSHVSAVLSGVMLKMGVYGLLRLTSLLPVGEGWWAPVVLVAGLTTGILGIAFALGQSDLKRLLAYSSVENIGIITLGVGLALLGRFQGNAAWVLLGLGGALLHVWNHGLFKPLLFFNAGAVMHATHTRRMDSLGGLGKTMPVTLALFVVGAAAICGLPPFNGFVGEWVLYLGFFQALLPSSPGVAGAAAVGAPALALIGALAVAGFVKVLGSVFLGDARTPPTHPAHDPGFAMQAPMLLLAAGCAALALGAPWVLPLAQAAATSWAGPIPVSLAAAVPVGWISLGSLALLLLIGGLALVVRPRGPAPKASRRTTWDCGYAEPQARMQYTGSSFSDGLVRLFAFVLRPLSSPPNLGEVFPRQWSFATRLPDLVLDRWLLPLSRAVSKVASRIHVFQQGQTHIYILYVLLATLALFAVAGFGAQP